ncbi:hypothetical protein GLAREA_04460 [Glarea lozoyensis ATCC 20868]|uniref:Uncharacterized protein n=2 Tax=Glarea lozoyensis TaxID=101852 RepID=S3CRD8_GLAL2|nr:uncharacterized protein GLAREA_04460 [Glarea lozoyensis ATCC 20868]EHL01891.1 hypothetical protein M7I_2073 [Glarea lozoyensis 74030]EPE27669.1 hypothetical protein GLAREA_04460 [Glarea lozoyensis ATCC 20868]
MSSRTLILSALAGVGAIAAANALSKPSKTQSIAAGMRSQLDDLNSAAHPVQNRRDTLLDRTELMESAKKRKPWNMTYAEREALSKE